MRRRHRRDDTEVALANFALTFAKALLVFCVILFIMVNPNQKKEDGIKPKIEYLITIDWPKDLNYDVDIWIKDPSGKILYYDDKEVDFLNLERDDLGKKNNTVDIDGSVVTVISNQELVSMRGFKPGEYVINAHLYSADQRATPAAVPPFKVTLRITKLNPSVVVVYEGQAEISSIRQEAHLVRFRLDSDGRSSGFTNELPTTIRPPLNEERGAPLIPPMGGQ